MTSLGYPYQYGTVSTIDLPVVGRPLRLRRILESLDASVTEVVKEAGCFDWAKRLWDAVWRWAVSLFWKPQEPISEELEVIDKSVGDPEECRWEIEEHGEAARASVASLIGTKKFTREEVEVPSEKFEHLYGPEFQDTDKGYSFDFFIEGQKVHNWEELCTCISSWSRSGYRAARDGYSTIKKCLAQAAVFFKDSLEEQVVWKIINIFQQGVNYIVYVKQAVADKCLEITFTIGNSTVTRTIEEVSE